MKKFTRIAAVLCAIMCLFSCMSGALAANVADATIDTSRTGSMEIYKYDLTNAEKDGVWDSSYVSTGVKDTAGVNDVLGNNSRVSDLGNGDVSYGYSIKGVEFTYLRVADIRTYTESENGQSHVEVLYGIPVNTTTDQMLNAIGVTHENRYSPADQTVGGALTYYYQSDTLIKGLEAALASNSTTVKNALENYVTANGGTAMPETDSYRQEGDYLIPNIGLPETTDHPPLGMYGRMRRTYLKEHRPILWDRMILQGTLFPHLRQIDRTANERLNRMIPELAAEAGATEELKARDPMKWVGLMNNCKAQAEEIIKAELIFA